MIERERDKAESNISGMSEYARECTKGSIDWNKPKIITTFNGKNKLTLQRNLLVSESLGKKKR